MNERIRELIKQCTITEFSDCSGGFETFDKEKFAELIVRECVEVAKQNDSDGSLNYNSGRTWAGIDILKHFGVAE
jgi:hypothetical protein